MEVGSMNRQWMCFFLSARTKYQERTSGCFISY
jgi:hypothetical protein